MTAYWSRPRQAWLSAPSGAMSLPDGALTIKIGRRFSTVVVALRGRFDTLGATRLAAVFDDLIDGQGNLAIAVELGDVHSVAPASLQVLAAAASRLERRGGTLSLVGAADSVSLSSLDAWGLSCVIASSPQERDTAGATPAGCGRPRTGHPAGRGMPDH